MRQRKSQFAGVITPRDFNVIVSPVAKKERNTKQVYINIYVSVLCGCDLPKGLYSFMIVLYFGECGGTGKGRLVCVKPTFD